MSERVQACSSCRVVLSASVGKGTPTILSPPRGQSRRVRRRNGIRRYLSSSVHTFRWLHIGRRYADFSVVDVRFEAIAQRFVTFEYAVRKNATGRFHRTSSRRGQQSASWRRQFRMTHAWPATTVVTCARLITVRAVCPSASEWPACVRSAVPVDIRCYCDSFKYRRRRSRRFRSPPAGDC